jgi:hypothetical protein
VPRYLLDDIEIWYGTPETPALAGAETEHAPAFTVGVAGAEDVAVHVQYRHPGGPWQRLRLRPKEGGAGTYIFTAQFPDLPAGTHIEYEVYVRRGGAQPEAERRVGARMSFQFGREPAKKAATSRKLSSSAAPDRASEQSSEVLMRAAVGILRQRPNAFAGRPLKAGEVAPEVPVNPEDCTMLYRIAFAEAAGAEPAALEASDGVVWTRGENELLVRPDGVRLLLRDGFALVSIPVFCEQTGDVEVVVPFALGRPGAPLGLVMATEPVPRGPAVVVECWGEHLVGAAWDALVHLAARVAAAAGGDHQPEALLPASLVASTSGLVVLPQAQHSFDRSRG